MKQVKLYYNSARGVWTHDSSGHSFVGWDEPESVANETGNTFAKVRDSAQKKLAAYFSGLPGHDGITAEDIQITWAQAPNRFQPPPTAVKLTNFQAERVELAADADPAATKAHDPKSLKPPERLSVA